MYRRLYYLIPDYKHTKLAVDELLLKRIDYKHIHVVASDDNELAGLPVASLFQRSDVRRSLVLGLVLGAFLGVLTGIAVHYFLDVPFAGYMIAITLTGALIGAWFSSMVGMMTPNTELKPFLKAIKEGQLLLMVDVPQMQVDKIDLMIKRLHPEAKEGGVEPTLPSFP